MKNAERDSHSFFRRLGLSLKLPIQCKQHHVDASVIETHHIRISDWISFLLTECPCLLAGGLEPLQSQLEAFWSMYKCAHPSHRFFQDFDESRWSHAIPVLLFGDEGKGPKRGNFLITTLESPIGVSEHQATPCVCAETVQKNASCVPTCYGPVAAATAQSRLAGKQDINYKSHSYLTRHILFGLPDFVYKEYPQIYQQLLSMLADELTSLYYTGTQVLGETFYTVLLGHKGDLKHAAEKVASMSRSYSHLGSVNHIHMCSLCLAGDRQYPWDENSARPAWVDSLFHSRPWIAEPPLSKVPFDDLAPELLYRLDLFHIVKVGLGRDIAGALVLLCRLRFFDCLPQDKLSLAARLRRAHTCFRLWCRASQKSPALRYFSPAFFNVKRLSDFPWANSKGSDTMLLLEFLHWYCASKRSNLADLPVHLQTHRKLLKLLCTTVDHCLSVFRICHSHALWMDRSCGQCLWLHMHTCLSGYHALAREALHLHMSAFSLKPKWHALQHVALDLEMALKTPSEKVLNPLIFGCDQNEDSVGRLCSLALKVSTRTIGQRVIQRHFLKTAALLRRHLKARRKKGIRL